MKTKTMTKTIMLSVLALVVLAAPAQAKWWIFGQSEDQVSLSYLYINKMSFDENTEAITLYKESLTNGTVEVRGRARVKNGAVGGVRVTIDGKRTWNEASLADNGAFVYSFTPQVGTPYEIYVEVMDTRGKTNAVEDTRRVVTVSDRNVRSLIRETLDAMVKAYSREDAQGFMRHVSGDFAGDDVNLDIAINKDFSNFDNISLHLALGGVAADPGGKIHVSLNYNRMLISARSGRALRDNGMTEFVFTLEGKTPKVFAMKNPLIFGLSDAAEVATGTVMQPPTTSVIVVDEHGNASTRPFGEAFNNPGDGADAGDTSEVEQGSFTLRYETIPASGETPEVVYVEGFDFSEGTKDSATQALTVGVPGAGDMFILFGNNLRPWHGTVQYDMGIHSISEITSVRTDDGNYSSWDIQNMSGQQGHCFAFHMLDGTYAVIEVVSFSSPNEKQGNGTFRYKYQPDGSTSF